MEYIYSVFMDFEFIILIFILSPKTLIDAQWFIVLSVVNRLANPLSP